jgi:hypothetical protein
MVKSSGANKRQERVYLTVEKRGHIGKCPPIKHKATVSIFVAITSCIIMLLSALPLTKAPAATYDPGANHYTSPPLQSASKAIHPASPSTNVIPHLSRFRLAQSTCIGDKDTAACTCPPPNLPDAIECRVGRGHCACCNSAVCYTP